MASVYNLRIPLRRHSLLPVYIKQHTEATPARQFPVTFMNRNLIHLSLCTFTKADESPVEDYYQAVLAALTLSRPDGTSSLFVKKNAKLVSKAWFVFLFCTKSLHILISINVTFLVLFGHIWLLHVRLVSLNWHLCLKKKTTKKPYLNWNEAFVWVTRW